MNIHKELAAGRWFELSLAEQLGNIGSEVLRASRIAFTSDNPKPQVLCYSTAPEKGGDEEDGKEEDGKGDDGDKDIFNGAAKRALELFDLTLSDPRWKGRYREIGRAREVFCDAVLGGKEYGSSLKDLNRYFFQFALAARTQC